MPSENRARPSHPSDFQEVLQIRKSESTNSNLPATSPAKKGNEGIEQSLLNILRGGNSQTTRSEKSQPQQHHSSIAPQVKNATSMTLPPYPQPEFTKALSVEHFLSPRETVLNSFKDVPIQSRQQPTPPTLTSENSMPHKHSLLKLLQQPNPQSQEPGSAESMHTAVQSTVQEEKVVRSVSRSNKSANKFDRERLHSPKVGDTQSSVSSNSSHFNIANQYRPSIENTSSDREGFVDIRHITNAIVNFTKSETPNQAQSLLAILRGGEQMSPTPNLRTKPTSRSNSIDISHNPPLVPKNLLANGNIDKRNTLLESPQEGVLQSPKSMLSNILLLPECSAQTLKPVLLRLKLSNQKSDRQLYTELCAAIREI